MGLEAAVPGKPAPLYVEEQPSPPLSGRQRSEEGACDDRAELRAAMRRLVLYTLARGRDVVLMPSMSPWL